MSINGKFNTDSDALQKRIESHDKFGVNDINQWIFKHLELTNNLLVLDLGCGTGKQSIPMAQFVGNFGKVISIDISQESLNTINIVAKQKKIENIIEIICSDLDCIKNKLKINYYNRALGSFSLYYAKDPNELFLNIYKSLKLNGILFFCGPSKENNSELKSFHNQLYENPNLSLSGGALFMEETGKELAKKYFGEVEVFNFENELKFNSPESLYSYWSSYNLYDKTVEEKFIDNAKNFFINNSVFSTTKRVVGIKAVKK